MGQLDINVDGHDFVSLMAARYGERPRWCTGHCDCAWHILVQVACQFDGVYSVYSRAVANDGGRRNGKVLVWGAKVLGLSKKMNCESGR